MEHKVALVTLIENIFLSFSKKKSLFKMTFSEPSKKKLRSVDKDYLIGEVNYQIMGAKLPSNRQVLSVLFFNARIAKLDIDTSKKS